MKIKLLYLCLILTGFLNAQNQSFEEQVKEISRKIERITLKEKSFLREKIKEIQKQEENKNITKEEAENQKIAAATLHATNIENKVLVFQTQLEGLVQKLVDKNIQSAEETENTTETGITLKREPEKNKDTFSKKLRSKKHKPKRTTSQFVLAYGINNVLIDQKFSSIDYSDYKFWKSHFYELGWTHKTRISKKASKVYFKYGASFVWNYLRAKDNKYQVTNGDKTNLQLHDQDLSESKFRNVYLNFPAHFEFDFSDNPKNSDGIRKDRSHKSIRIGLGGFAGIKLGTRQYLKYNDEALLKQKGDFNVSKFTYGLSTYVAYKSLGIYAKYDLVSLFKNTETRNVSIGLRCDFN